MSIDKQVAERIMGWKQFPNNNYSIGNDKCRVWEKWKPSTNIQHAMEVEAEMFRRGYLCKTDHLPDDSHYCLFSKIVTGDFERISGESIAEALPEAICLASLEAISHE